MNKTEPGGEFHVRGVQTPCWTATGLTRDIAYELAVIFTKAVSRVWTRTLVIECVA